MYNEFIFLAHALCVSGMLVLALRYSYAAVVAVLGLQLIVANLFVTKQITLLGIETTCSEVFVVGGMYGISLVRLYFGDTRARWAIWAAFAFLLFFVCMVPFHLAYEGVDGVVATALQQVCHTTPRLFVASITAYLLSERVHLLLTRYAGQIMPGALASMCAIAGGQLVDTLLFAGIGLSGLVSNMGSVIVFCLLVKLCVILLLAPLLVFTERFIKKASPLF